MSAKMSMKQALTEMGIFYPKRYSRKNKLHFLNHFTNQLDQKKIPYSFLEFNHGLKIKHLCIGDFEHAKRIIIAHYDTPSLMLLPHYHTTPLNAKKVIIKERENSILSTVISLFFVGAIVGITSPIQSYAFGLKIVVILLDVLLAYVACKFAKGLPKPMNMNSNSAAIAVLYKLLMNQTWKETAMILVDCGAQFTTGYLQISQRKELLNKDVLILNNIGYGEQCIVCCDGKSEDFATQLANGMNQGQLKKLTEKEMNKSIVGMFSSPVFIFAADEVKGEYRIQKTRSKKDLKVNLKQVDEIAEAIARYCI